jgi:hypothetical protein
MSEDNTIDTLQVQEEVQIAPAPTAQTVQTKPAKKPAFKRATPEKPTEKAPMFKRAGKPITNQAITVSDDQPTLTTPIPAPNSPASPSVVVQAPNPAPISQSPIKGDYEQISHLIAIRDYINALVSGNYNTEKSKIHDLQKISLLLDRKIVDALVSPEFKSFVNFADAQSAVQAAARQNNIRSSLYGQ